MVCAWRAWWRRDTHGSPGDVPHFVAYVLVTGSLWCCCDLLWWQVHLCLDWKHFIVESPLGLWHGWFHGTLHHWRKCGGHSQFLLESVNRDQLAPIQLHLHCWEGRSALLSAGLHWGWLSLSLGMSLGVHPALDRDQSEPVVMQRPALIIHWPNYLWRSPISWSWHWWVRTLGTTWYQPQYTSSASFRISSLAEPNRLLTDWWTGAVSLDVTDWWE